MMTSKHRDSGTTLVEVLLVILVLGLLAAVVGYSLPENDTTVLAVSCDDDARSLAEAAHAYLEQHDAAFIPGTGFGDDRYETTLADRGLLDRPSEKYDVGPTGDVVPASGSDCDG